MIGKKRIMVFLVLFTCGALQLHSTSFAQETPTHLMEKVKKMGAKSVVFGLWEKHGEWAKAMNRIASGQ